MSRKATNHINVEKALLLITEGYSLQAKRFNFYQFRIHHEEKRWIFYDWYHTTGSLVKCKNGMNKSMGVYKDPENLAIFITKDLDKED